MIKSNHLLTLVSILFFQASYCQSSDFSKYAIALSEITTFADNPGFKDEVILKSSSKDIEWVTGEDGYNYTVDIEFIRVFGYKVLFESDNNLIIGVYYDSEGSTTYTYLLYVTTTETKLVLNQVIGGGDRCHNAVLLEDVEVVNKQLIFSSLITPNKLMNWYSESDEATNFEDCLTCCIGFAKFKYDLMKKTLEFESITLIEEVLEEDTAVKKTYDEFVQERPLKLSLMLNQEELKQFISDCKDNL